MNVAEREKRYIRKWRQLAKAGHRMAMMNVAAAYRILGNRRLSFRWYKRAADLRDGEALLEVGYCYHHGLGVRQDDSKAENAYRSAIATRKYITAYGREEAMYSLSVLLLELRPTAWRREALRLLRRAAADGDYPQARELRDVLLKNEDTEVCVCRRFLMRRLARQACRIHR